MLLCSYLGVAMGECQAPFVQAKVEAEILVFPFKKLIHPILALTTRETTARKPRGNERLFSVKVTSTAFHLEPSLHKAENNPDRRGCFTIVRRIRHVFLIYLSTTGPNTACLSPAWKKVVNNDRQRTVLRGTLVE